MGTRLWYGFYGDTLTDMGVFDGKVEELCRELGERGRGGDDESTAQSRDEMVPVSLAEAELRAELGRLNLKQLRERTLVAGVSGDVVEEARDADDPKAALMSLLVRRQVEAGSSAGLLLAISAGGESAVLMLVSVLEHASDVLDALSSSMPRRSRKAVLEVLTQVESVYESVPESESE